MLIQGANLLSVFATPQGGKIVLVGERHQRDTCSEEAVTVQDFVTKQLYRRPIGERVGVFLEGNFKERQELEAYSTLGDFNNTFEALNEDPLVRVQYTDPRRLLGMTFLEMMQKILAAKPTQQTLLEGLDFLLGSRDPVDINSFRFLVDNLNFELEYSYALENEFEPEVKEAVSNSLAAAYQEELDQALEEFSATCFIFLSAAFDMYTLCSCLQTLKHGSAVLVSGSAHTRTFVRFFRNILQTEPEITYRSPSGENCLRISDDFEIW